MSTRAPEIELRVTPRELNILLDWATRCDAMALGAPKAEQALAMQLHEGEAQLLLHAFNGVQFVEDEHAVVPTLIDVASWKLPKL